MAKTRTYRAHSRRQRHVFSTEPVPPVVKFSPICGMYYWRQGGIGNDYYEMLKAIRQSPTRPLIRRSGMGVCLVLQSGPIRMLRLQL